jgi:hypothetical protein
VKRFDLSSYQLVPYRDNPELGMLFTDCVGPWWEQDGTEIVIPISESFGAAIENTVGTWTVRTNANNHDHPPQTFRVGFPELTLLVQQEWDRVIHAASRTANRSFLVQLEGFEPTTGQVCEQLMLTLWFDHIATKAPKTVALATTDDAVSTGLLQQPSKGIRSNDAVIIDTETGQVIAVIESKATVNRWSALLRRVRDKALDQLLTTAAANPDIDVELGVFGCSLRDRQVGFYVLRSRDLGRAQLDWTTTHRSWRPTRDQRASLVTENATSDQLPNLIGPGPDDAEAQQ